MVSGPDPARHARQEVHSERHWKEDIEVAITVEVSQRRATEEEGEWVLRDDSSSRTEQHQLRSARRCASGNHVCHAVARHIAREASAAREREVEEAPEVGDGPKTAPPPASRWAGATTPLPEKSRRGPSPASVVYTVSVASAERATTSHPRKSRRLVMPSPRRENGDEGMAHRRSLQQVGLEHHEAAIRRDVRPYRVRVVIRNAVHVARAVVVTQQA